MSAEQRASDLRVLRALSRGNLDDEEIPEAFEEMLIRLEERRAEVLTPKQRRWVNSVARRIIDDESTGPEDGGPESTRLTPGVVPRGREVAPLFVKGQLKPPNRR